MCVDVRGGGNEGCGSRGPGMSDPFDRILSL